MHVQTHLMSGWCIGNLFRLTSRQRLFCMLAASLADLDGLSILGGERSYQEWHHVLGHNVFFALLFCVVLAALSRRPFFSVILYLALAHLHLVLDYFGSGPLWRIYYLWPADRKWYITYAGAWEFFSWQNISAAAFFLLWTILIAYVHRRTPLEAIMPKLDRQLIALLPRRESPQSSGVV